MKLNSIKSLKVEEVVGLSTPPDIQEEDFELDKNFMYALTPENAEKAQQLIENTPRYKNAAYKKYYEVDKAKRSLKSYSEKEFREIIKKISTSNSTRTPDENIDVLASYIFENKSEFLKRLEKGDTSLVDELTALNGLSRKERSLSSKICAYLSELEYGKIKFAVNDSVVRKILPYYLHYYKVCQKKGNLDNRSYSEITGLIDKIIGNLPRKLEYAEIDRIIWYCYKSDPVRTSISISLNNRVNAGGK